jgi:hypothetical protein
MKKVVITAIAVLFLVVSFEYASAQQQNLGGKLTGLSLRVTYQQELVPKDPTKQSEGDKLVTKTSGIKKGAKYNPVLYIEVDPEGNPLLIDFYWKNPKSGIKILTMSCPSPAIISSKPMISTTRPPAAVTSSFKGFGVCTFCPGGINGIITGTTCNSGQAGFGILYVQGTVHKNTTDGTITSVSIDGGVDGADFNYLGEDDWASANCILYPDFLACPAFFEGGFGATLKPCAEIDPLGDPQCQNL